MSQMGAVIKAVRRLFNDRGEMLSAHNRDEKLYLAARIFNKAIDDFECREHAKREKIKKGGYEERVQHIKQNELKIANVVKVNSPPPVSTQTPNQTENTPAQPSNKTRGGAKTVGMLARELHKPIKDTLLLLSALGIDKCAQGYTLSADQTAKVYDYILKSAENEKSTQNQAPPFSAPKIKQKPDPNLIKKKSTLTKGKQNKIKAAATARNKGPRSSGTLCIKCNKRFSNISAHSCSTSRQKPVSTNKKPPATSKRKPGEQDVTRKPRLTVFDKSTSGTSRATKLAGATKQGSNRADKSHAERYNAKFIKGGKKVGRR